MIDDAGEWAPDSPEPWWVLPMMKPVWARDCITSLSPEVHARLTVVDNSAARLGTDLAEHVHYVRTGTNLGCSASWNVGRREALAQPRT